jgi:hypothetical protein
MEGRAAGSSAGGTRFASVEIYTVYGIGVFSGKLDRDISAWRGLR